MSWAQDPPPEKVISIGGLQIDGESRLVTIRGQQIHLSPTEFELLYYLMSHAGQVVQKQKLFRDVWGYDCHEDTNLVEVGVRRLREKVEFDPSAPQYIRTIRGAGYKFAESI